MLRSVRKPTIEKLNRRVQYNNNNRRKGGRVYSPYGQENVRDLLHPKGSHSSRPPSGTVRGRWRSSTPVPSDFLAPVGSGTPSFVSLDRRVRCACAAPLAAGRP